MPYPIIALSCPRLYRPPFLAQLLDLLRPPIMRVLDRDLAIRPLLLHPTRRPRPLRRSRGLGVLLSLHTLAHTHFNNTGKEQLTTLSARNVSHTFSSSPASPISWFTLTISVSRYSSTTFSLARSCFFFVIMMWADSAVSLAVGRGGMVEVVGVVDFEALWVSWVLWVLWLLRAVLTECSIGLEEEVIVVRCVDAAKV